jgi:nitrogenase molybdenum-cofactor synthesis protein NifE
LGIAFCDFNHDRTTQFEGFDGMVNFAREVDITINSPVWKLPVKRECQVRYRITEVEDARVPCPIHGNS